MNVTLYNQLMNAKACLKENARIDKIIAGTRRQIESNEHYLSTCKSVKEYRKTKKEPFIDKAGRFFSKLAFPEVEGCLSAFFHYVYLFPLVAACAILFYIFYGVYYLLGYPIIKKNENKLDIKYKKEYEESIKIAKNRIVSLENDIKALKRERKAFNEKMGYPLVALYEGYRREEAIDYMLESMRQYPNYFQSLDEVQNFLKQHYINLSEAEQRNEERAEIDRRHKETQDALETIARNQERIASDIERAEKERKERLWW